MHQIQIQAYGGPEVLEQAPAEPIPLGQGELRLRVIAAAVNHTDLKIRAGLWPIRKAEPFPYVPGVEAVGQVIKVGPGVTGFDLGQRVITMMQGLGGVRAERPGAYADEITVAACAVARIAADPLAMAALGLAGVTALEGLTRLGPLAGREILVTGAGGAVGLAALGIARAMGASVTGIVASRSRAQAVEAMGAAVHLTARVDPGPLPACDGILDTVGAPLFSRSLEALRPGGTFSLVGAVGGSGVPLDLWELIRPIVLTGYSSETLDGPALRRAMARLEPMVVEGRLALPPPTVLPLAEAVRAHQGLESGEIQGRVVLCP